MIIHQTEGEKHATYLSSQVLVAVTLVGHKDALRTHVHAAFEIEGSRYVTMVTAISAILTEWLEW